MDITKFPIKRQKRLSLRCRLSFTRLFDIIPSIRICYQLKISYNQGVKIVAKDNI
jgi:hypothetical protein